MEIPGNKFGGVGDEPLRRIFGPHVKKFVMGGGSWSYAPSVALVAAFRLGLVSMLVDFEYSQVARE